MRFFALFAAASVAAVGVGAEPLFINLDVGGLIGAELSTSSSYGAPIPPWTPGCKPGWYLGDHPRQHPDLVHLKGFICHILALLPAHWIRCPPPPPPTVVDGYYQTFSNLTGATQASGYLTYGLVDTVQQCEAMCNGVSGCAFVNSYHDVNGKGGSTQLTCSLFSTCHNATDATNTGGQSQPDGTLNYIINSDGYCKASP